MSSLDTLHNLGEGPPGPQDGNLLPGFQGKVKRSIPCGVQALVGPRLSRQILTREGEGVIHVAIRAVAAQAALPLNCNHHLDPTGGQRAGSATVTFFPVEYPQRLATLFRNFSKIEL